MENQMLFYENSHQLEVKFIGDIDHQTTILYRNQLIARIDNTTCNEIILNFEKVNFIDSSGIGMVLGRYNQIKQSNKVLYFSNLSDVTYRLFEISGLLNLIPIKEVSYNG